MTSSIAKEVLKILAAATGRDCLGGSRSSPTELPLRIIRVMVHCQRESVSRFSPTKGGRMKNFSSAKFEQSFEKTEERIGVKADILRPEDFIIEKQAGIAVSEPTIDNLEHFIKEYLSNEIYYINRKLPINVNLIPSAMKKSNPELVDTGSGTADFKYEGATVELPFVIYDGELVPFDVIQLGNQRIPYSTSNMKKVLNGITSQNESHKDGSEVDGSKPYLGVAKPINPSTSIGFLGATMSIQDQYLGKGSGDSYHIYASEDIEKNLVKLANLKPVDEKIILGLFEKVAQEQLIERFEKIAAEDDSQQKYMEKVFEKMASSDWKNAATLSNNTFILIPEIKESNAPNSTPEVVMTPAVVIDNFFDFGLKFKPKKTVITVDQRMKILGSGETMICLVSDKPTFTLPTAQLDSVQEDNIIVAFKGDKALFPVRVTDTRNRSFEGAVPWYDESHDQIRSSKTTPKNSEMGKIYSFSMVGCNGQQSVFVGGDNGDEVKWGDTGYAENNFRLATLAGKCFDTIPYTEFILAKAKETSLDPQVLENVFSTYSTTSSTTQYPNGGSQPKADTKNLGVITSDPETRVVIISGVITDYLHDAKAINKFISREDNLMKTASASEYVTVKTRDIKNNTYDVKLVYTDRSKKIFSQQVKNFDNIEDYKARGILRATGFDQQTAAEIIQTAKQAHFAKQDLPADATPQDVSGSAPKSMAETRFNNVKETVFSPDVKKELAVSLVNHFYDSVTGANSMGIGTKNNNNNNSNYKKASEGQWELLVDGLKAHAKKAAAVSSIFEKLAMQHESSDFRDVAMACVLSCNLLEKTAQIITSDDYYCFETIADDIIKGQPYFEKMAYDLVALKTEEYKNGNFFVNPNHIHQAVLSIDDMIKTANDISRVYNKECV